MEGIDPALHGMVKVLDVMLLTACVDAVQHGN